jgi:NADPH:quinone reductase-like Zn-dependent oxidoreductase
VAPNGVIVLAGADKRGGMAIFARIAAALVRSRLLHQRIVFYVANANREDLLVLKELIEAGKVRPAIDRTYPLSQAADAVRYVGTGKARAKVVVTID